MTSMINIFIFFWQFSQSRILPKQSQRCMRLGFDRRLKQRRLFVSPVFSFGQAWRPAQSENISWKCRRNWNENEKSPLTGKDAPTAQSVTDKTTAVSAAGIAGTQTRRGIFLRWNVCKQQKTDGLDGLRRAADRQQNESLMQAKGSVPPILTQRRFWSVRSYHKTLPDSLSLRGWLTNR